MVLKYRSQVSRKKMAEDKRIIKKYPNRRLYDTVESQYITLDNVKELVMGNVDFIVLDQKTNEDITRTILLQIIMEQEDDDEPIFSAEVLGKIIRLYGDEAQDMASSFLERSFSMFSQQQDQFNARMTEAMRQNPISAMTEVTQKNMRIWQKMQDDFFNMASFGMSKKTDKE